MSRSSVYHVNIEFGDCDPAGIVFFPNFLRWMDAASLHFFVTHGIPPWREYEKTTGIIGTPLLEIQTKFIRSATYGETLAITSTIEAVNPKSFVQKHVVRRGDDLICEGLETRIFCKRNPETGKIFGIPFPDEVRERCC